MGNLLWVPLIVGLLYGKGIPYYIWKLEGCIYKKIKWKLFNGAFIKDTYWDILWGHLLMDYISESIDVLVVFII